VLVAPDGVEFMEGDLRANFVGVRTADGLYRFFGRNAWGGPVGMVIHAFGEDVDKEALERAWKAWLDGLYG
jgi:hypothetical protein